MEIVTPNTFLLIFQWARVRITNAPAFEIAIDLRVAGAQRPMRHPGTSPRSTTPVIMAALCVFRCKGRSGSGEGGEGQI